MTHRDAPPMAKQLVLAGGGHSHALLLRMLAMRPLPGVQVTLVSDAGFAPYSGMLPGHIAGHYRREEIHIDLRRLCVFANARFVLAPVAGLDLENKRLAVEGRPPLAFDVLSLNTGGAPTTEGIRGAEFAAPCKPVPKLLAAWDVLLERAAEEPPRLLVIGGGAGGVELALSMRQGLRGRCRIAVAHHGAEVMTGHNQRVRRVFADLLREQGIETILGARVVELTPTSAVTEDGRTLPFDRAFLATPASAPAWIRESGLSTAPDGTVLVSATLQSLSHDFVFAAGDVATIAHDPRPKSGVFAVRMAKPLAANLRAHFRRAPLRDYRPQRHFLSLVGAGAGVAVASRRWLAWKSPALWTLKEHIDRKFMRKFSELPSMVEDEPLSNDGSLESLKRRAQMRCLGCAAKVSAGPLTRVIERLKIAHPEIVQHPAERGVVAGLDAPDDAAVFLVPEGQALLQTVDYMPALVADPFLFGRIATLHSFSDIFAMGGQAHSCLAAALVPFAAEAVTEETLFQLLSGVLHELRLMGASLLGGHTAEGAALGLALTCNGFGSPVAILEKGGLRKGDALILTKALGTGVIFAADMRLRANGSWTQAAVESMLLSNQQAARIVLAHGARGCTDVTGFGFAGHLLEMLRSADLAAEVNLDTLPALPGALSLFGDNLRSSLHEGNSRAMGDIHAPAKLMADERFPLLFDPQTSGGLLVGLRPEVAEACLRDLQAAGYRDAAIVGRVKVAEPPAARLVLA